METIIDKDSNTGPKISMSKTEFAQLDNKETWAEIGVEAGWISEESLAYEVIIIRPIAGVLQGESSARC